MVSGKTEEVETKGVRDDGSSFYVHNRAAPFFGADGKLRGFIEMVENIDARKKLEERNLHLNRVLLAIRSVNQLITKEKDPAKLIYNICRSLLEKGGYINIWISLFDENGALKVFSGDKVEKDFPGIKKAQEAGKRLKCQEMALKKEGVVAIKDPSSTCGYCPMSKSYEGKVAFCSRLAYEGKVFGTMTVSLQKMLAMDKKERDLFDELTGDLSYALSAIEIEKRQMAMQTEKERHIHELEVFYRSAIGRENRILELKKEIKDLKKAVR